MSPRDYLEEHPRAPLYVTVVCILLMIAVQFVLPRIAFIAALALFPIMLLSWGAWLFFVPPTTGFHRTWVLVIVIVLVLSPITHFFVRRTDSFRLAESCLRTSKAVRAAIGEVTRFDLDIFPTFDIVTGISGRTNGHARFVGNIVSDDSTKRGEVILERSHGRWVVTQLRIPPRSAATSTELNQEELQCH